MQRHGLPASNSGRLDAPTGAGLLEFGRLPAGTPLRSVLTGVLDSLFRFVASAGRVR